MGVLRLAIGVALVCVVLRTFVALGIINPVVVVGSSMAPGLAEGDRVVVDRASIAWRSLQRWERVVTRSPDDARRLAIKRVVGLPGERIEFRQGDLWVDGKIVRKSLAEQLAMRVLVHRQTPSDDRWRKLDTDPQSQIYRHPGDGVLRDELAINRLVSRRLNAVADLMLTCQVEPPTDLPWQAELAAAGKSLQLRLAAETWRVTLDSPAGRVARGGKLPLNSGGKRIAVVLSLFDRQALVALNEQPLVELPTPGDSTPQRASPPRLVTPAAGTHELAVWRDVYYEQRPIDLAPADPAGGWRLGADRWFLVGDNQAISHDSRSWRTGRAGVPGRLLMGRAAAN